ncbi:MAG: hypothetical protein IPF60_02155 [Betaproteobacteria bacterium]|nr:hypothetical protein [Betaproteobacteria bacterium]
MNLQQLRYVRETVRRNLNITEANERAVHLAAGRLEADQGTRTTSSASRSSCAAAGASASTGPGGAVVR